MANDLISQETIEAFAKALSDFAVATVRVIEKWAKAISEWLPILPDLQSVYRINDAYSKAKIEHPEWVHRAEYSKKKRIRKKYHDRIIREYSERRCE